MKNRSRYEVIAAIISSCIRMETRTKIMYKAMLSNDQCKLYIQFLLKCGLINEVLNGEKRYYIITESGNKFLVNFEKLKEMLPSIMEGEIEEHHNLTI
ncbi:MAG TPA: winged helix-turn-helix domain-containing protein [Nitrososphaeraceae archaeon]|nr:winged helix-turn-helix domain-containing protein [Nitrososphaeraceae archaeon]